MFFFYSSANIQKPFEKMLSIRELDFLTYEWNSFKQHKSHYAHCAHILILSTLHTYDIYDMNYEANQMRSLLTP